MELNQSVKAFSALAQDTRLSILKMLVKAGTDGLCPCNLIEALDLTSANLSFHLKELENAGLVEKEKKGKFIHYRANCDFIKRLGDFLIEDCGKFKCENKKKECKNV